MTERKERNPQFIRVYVITTKVKEMKGLNIKYLELASKCEGINGLGKFHFWFKYLV